MVNNSIKIHSHNQNYQAYYISILRALVTYIAFSYTDTDSYIVVFLQIYSFRV